MRDSPILVTSQLVPEVRSGRKKVTRRTNRLEYVNRDPDNFRLDYLKGDPVAGWIACFVSKASGYKTNIKSPYGGPGDILWVRENWFTVPCYDSMRPAAVPEGERVGFIADGPKPDWAGKTRTSLYLPRWLARTELVITELGLEQLHSITEKGAELEGVPKGIFRDGPETAARQFHLELNMHGSYRDGFKWIWATLNGRDSWELNPWVWVISFKLKPDNQ